jgi:hypothetical protein
VEDKNIWLVAAVLVVLYFLTRKKSPALAPAAPAPAPGYPQFGGANGLVGPKPAAPTLSPEEQAGIQAAQQLGTAAVGIIGSLFKSGSFSSSNNTTETAGAVDTDNSNAGLDVSTTSDWTPAEIDEG